MKPFLSATCIGCGCTDARACISTLTDQPCYWLRLDRDAGVGVCSECRNLVSAWDRGTRTQEGVSACR